MANELKRQDRGGASASTWFLTASSRPPMQVPGADLLSTVNEEILPRLALAHSGEASVPADQRLPPTEEEIAELARIALDGDTRGALRLVMSLEGQGLSVASILLLLVAPAARFVREQWLSERRSFTEVTAALGVIHAVIGELRACTLPASSDPDERE